MQREDEIRKEISEEWNWLNVERICQEINQLIVKKRQISILMMITRKFHVLMKGGFR